MFLFNILFVCAAAAAAERSAFVCECVVFMSERTRAVENRFNFLNLNEIELIYYKRVRVCNGKFAIDKRESERCGWLAGEYNKLHFAVCEFSTSIYKAFFI